MEQRVEIGRIVRLQVQLSSLKAGPPKEKYYDPEPLHEVQEIDVNIEGAIACADDNRIVDVHNSAHPATKNRSGINSLSIGFTSHYARMRQQFGAHLVDGIAGENILVETDQHIDLEQARGGFVIEGDDGRQVHLTGISVAHPCAEFSRFALDDLQASPIDVSATLKFLDNGCRGYYAAVESLQPRRVEVGDRVFVVRDH